MLKRIILLMLFILLSVLFISGNAGAAYYGVYDIRDDDDEPDEYPGTEHFDWVNRSYTYTYGESETFSINVVLNAPDNWTTQEGIDYTGYRVSDHDYGTTTVWESSPGDFDNVYSYFYQVENTGSSNITSIDIPYDPATVTGFGYFEESGFENIGSMDISSNTFTVTFDGLGLGADETSSWFFMTSEYWWGWQPLTLNGETSVSGSTYLSSIHNSPDGMVPAPNPEASTVALYIIGLIGMGTLYYRKKKMAEMEV